VPARAGRPTIEDLLRAAFARYDPIALGGAVGTVAGLGLLLATVWVLARDVGAAPPLSLLGNYLFGYTVTWRGAALGLVEAGAGGFALGWILARSINAMIGWQETILRRELQAAGTLDPLAVGEP